MSFLRTGPWCLVLLLGLVPAPASAADKQAVLEFAMAVDAQGHPTDVRAPEGLPPSIGESVQAWARDLRFVPATVDGVAQPSTTTLRSEERRGGKECDSTCRSRRAQYH